MYIHVCVRAHVYIEGLTDTSIFSQLLPFEQKLRLSSSSPYCNLGFPEGFFFFFLN